MKYSNLYLRLTKQVSFIWITLTVVGAPPIKRCNGGITNKADEERVYIIKANGAVKISESSNWFASASTQIAPGDTIVVPLGAVKVDQLILWRDLSQVFYQVALSAAVVGGLSGFVYVRDKNYGATRQAAVLWKVGVNVN